MSTLPSINPFAENFLGYNDLYEEYASYLELRTQLFGREYKSGDVVWRFSSSSKDMFKDIDPDIDSIKSYIAIRTSKIEVTLFDVEIAIYNCTIECQSCLVKFDRKKADRFLAGELDTCSFDIVYLDSSTVKHSYERFEVIENCVSELIEG